MVDPTLAKTNSKKIEEQERTYGFLLCRNRAPTLRVGAVAFATSLPMLRQATRPLQKLVIKVSLLSSSLNSRQGMFCRFFMCSTNKQEFHKWRFITQQ
ncbi:hypothetical protein [Xanthomonas campestris]|uniref:hypothetical protein n=1 Tax=Xanthomonas TaxID=338 RepID=UPI001E4B7814|nr:hypothetical protein [Xanthomonas campestris]MCC5088751.1 hypothetical protein [Xanthomonas campestris]